MVRSLPTSDDAEHSVTKSVQIEQALRNKLTQGVLIPGPRFARPGMTTTR
jgi:hypothetical protein